MITNIEVSQTISTMAMYCPDFWLTAFVGPTQSRCFIVVLVSDNDVFYWFQKCFLSSVTNLRQSQKNGEELGVAQYFEVPHLCAKWVEDGISDISDVQKTMKNINLPMLIEGNKIKLRLVNVTVMFRFLSSFCSTFCKRLLFFQFILSRTTMGSVLLLCEPFASARCIRT